MHIIPNKTTSFDSFLGKRAPRALKSNKIDRVCPAYATVERIFGQQIKVVTCLTHSGHDNALRRLPLPESACNRVASLINCGQDTTQILHTITSINNAIC